MPTREGNVIGIPKEELSTMATCSARPTGSRPASVDSSQSGAPVAA
jgi:hypothetical protein